ncbi:MAG: glycosyl transferase [Thermoanaerobaculaceae bacterium]
MSDFKQSGTIVTFPRLRPRDEAQREDELVTHARRTPLALVMPCLVSELEQPALAGMVARLAGTPYLDTVVISLDRADAAGYERALEYFRALHLRTMVVWNDAEAVAGIIREIEMAVLNLGPRGKGRAVWVALGAVIAEERAEAVAFLDADVVSFERSLLTNLVYPILHPALDFDYAKGYYARYSDRLHGRVTRLMVRPLLQALLNTVGHHPYLEYVDSFRYPLSGEFAVHATLLRRLRIPSDWGLEVGLLFEVLRHRSPRRICQVDVADRFDHKHQVLSPDNPGGGLHRMAVDITKHLLRTLAAAGVIVPSGSFKALQVAFQRYAEDAVADSFAVAVFNGLAYDRHAEEEAVDVFTKAFAEGCEQFNQDPLGTPAMPNWARVLSAMPGIGDRLLAAVRALGGVLEP